MEDHKCGMRVTTMSQALSNRPFFSFLHHKIMVPHHNKRRPSPEALERYIRPYVLLTRAIFSVCGLNVAIPALTCYQALYTRKSPIDQRKTALWKPPGSRSKLYVSYISHTEETDTWLRMRDPSKYDSISDNLNFIELEGGNSLHKSPMNRGSSLSLTWLQLLRFIGQTWKPKIISGGIGDAVQKKTAKDTFYHD
jgi:hypothetical protein